MSNSSLVDYVKISPNKTAPRADKITHIVIHHMSGNLSVETCGEVFQPESRQASSNYGIGSDGRIGMYVEEKDRAWTTGNRGIDNKAITIEVANDTGAPEWHVSDKALEATINLCVDICKRNGINELNFTGDKTGNLHMHKWYQDTDCPGPYLGSKFKYIADQVNKRLNCIRYRVHQQSIGWTEWVNEGEQAGVTGQKKRIEAIQIDPNGRKIKVKLHIQGIGWKDYGEITKDTIIGTTGQSRRIEAITISGATVQVHCESLGWMNTYGNNGGTLGFAKRIEALKIKAQ